jgi:2-methylisocitrate lyase-like PEP mutase family enzyme
MGFRIGIYPSQTHRAAIFAAQEVLAILKRDGDAAAYETRMVTFQGREVAVGTSRWNELERKYMS